MHPIPAIDLIDGKCVRLTQGDYATKKVYYEDPVEAARQFEDHGITRLHLVDLDGAKARHIVNHRTLERIATQTQLHIDFGGGLGSDEDLRIAFESGARQVTGGSIAVRQPDVFWGWLEKFGPERIILGADCKHRRIATHGWLETSDLDVLDFIKDYEQRGVRYVICTDIAQDGTLAGPSVALYREILAETNVQLIASGGVGTLADLYELRDAGCYGAILGKALYEGRIALPDLRALSPCPPGATV